MLTDLGYAVVEATSAEEAIRLISNGLKPQLLVTDHLMTSMNGTDLLDVYVLNHREPRCGLYLVTPIARALRPTSPEW